MSRNDEIFIDLSKLDNKSIAVRNRIARLAQIAQSAHLTLFDVSEFKRNSPPEIHNSSVNNVIPDLPVLFIELLRADARDGKLAQLLREGSD